MRTEHTIEISVKSFFAGMSSAEQVFFDLLRRRIADRLAIGIEPASEGAYTAETAVFPGVYAPARETCYE